ncbi:MAG: PadR family transcriptional regulator [Bacteroidetes bacterium]|nr:PadR family transcriptional regulator [Bacteroidota bacterium]
MITRVEELILLSVWKLQEDAYGAAIRNLLTNETGDDWPIATVYTPLDRMTRKGFLVSSVGLPTPERGGRSKKLYRLTSHGVSALESSKRLSRAMWSDLPELVVVRA